ncbi:MAG: transport-associated protein [Acidobacteria bacterium]|nr:MAG: transport-associated protein [Acidobacteriota bacterium]
MKNSIRLLLNSVFCSVLVSSFSVGTAASQSANQQSVLQIESPDQRTGNQLEAIAERVRHEMLMLPYYGVFDWLEGEVRPDGSVILRGEVVRPSLKSDAEFRVKRIESVTNVVNEIRVLPLSTMDDGLRIALYRAIFYSSLARYSLGAVSPIHIIVRNGRATLKGVVGSEMDKQLAYMSARGVPGLFDVKNELMAEYKAAN